MSKIHIPFPEIGQYRNCIKSVRERAEHLGVPLPTISFIGSVKLHGTNASIVFPETGEPYCQSRQQLIDSEHDNAGFAKWYEDNKEKFSEFNGRNLVVYGEWCGQGIQKGVAVSQLPKNFVIFAIRVLVGRDNSVWVDPRDFLLFPYENSGLTCIYNYPTWEITIDFNHPEEAQNRLVELTQAVENECPVGKAHGVSGVGEGIVWWPLPHPTFNVRDLEFKVKGEKHSESKVKTLAPVDVEKLNSIKELVGTILTEHRLEKKLDSLKELGLELEMKNTGAYLKLVGQDVIKEEVDTIDASGLSRNEVMGEVNKRAKSYWMEKINENIG
jgi:hypothetical protein